MTMIVDLDYMHDELTAECKFVDEQMDRNRTERRRLEQESEVLRQRLLDLQQKCYAVAAARRALS